MSKTSRTRSKTPRYRQAPPPVPPVGAVVCAHCQCWIYPENGVLPAACKRCGKAVPS